MRPVIVLFVAMAAISAHGENSAPLVSSVPHGYVFDQPRVLTQQRLFGLAHGISLLADRCFDQPPHGEEARQAYAVWHHRQETTIAQARRELARYYFGERADEAAWPDIVRALGLKNELPLKPDSAKLKAACATLPQALARYHSDLAAQFDLQADVSRLTAATETEARTEACKALLGTDAVAALDAGLDAWRQAYGAAVVEARRTVEQRWQEAKLEGTLDQWLNQMRGGGRRQASAERCAALPAWLATPAADPDAPFNRMP